MENWSREKDGTYLLKPNSYLKFQMEFTISRLQATKERVIDIVEDLFNFYGLDATIKSLGGVILQDFKIEGMDNSNKIVPAFNAIKKRLRV